MTFYVRTQGDKSHRRRSPMSIELNNEEGGDVSIKAREELKFPELLDSLKAPNKMSNLAKVTKR